MCGGLLFHNILNKVIKVSSCWARQYETSICSSKRSETRQLPVDNSDSTWIVLSTDGAVDRGSGHAAFGGVIRNRDGTWILGYTCFLGVCSPFEAEVWAILDGILISLAKGYRRVIIQTDNLEVAQILSDLRLEESGIAVLQRTQRIMKTEGNWQIRHIPISQNLAADCLAKLSLSWKINLQILNEAPKEIRILLQEEKDNGWLL
ncbi:hypothetical protein PVK06_036568 [Gossypium arboreum]|uniref:RNase H type-1 domain-containing protein n=1 Tax=Gossypium arboreum TaxID=29729 RepID=A0ABR0NJW5_GOSAR|nr:hypothetical protein PVK06_036568 [Gossypium arboreum]